MVVCVVVWCMVSEFGEFVGKIVGYCVCMEIWISVWMWIEVIIEGVFMWFVFDDLELMGILVILFDEFYECFLDGDLSFVFSLEV